MALVEVNEMFSSQMTFLKTYSEQHNDKKAELQKIDRKIDELKPIVNQYNDLVENKKELMKELTTQEKFLLSMNSMVQRVTGEPIDQGPLFNKHEPSEEDE